MDSVELNNTCSGGIRLVVNNSGNVSTVSISKDVLARSSVLQNLRVPLSLSSSLDIPTGYIHSWLSHVQRSPPRKLCEPTDRTDSLLTLLKASVVLEDTDLSRSVNEELSKRLLSALTVTNETTKKRKRGAEGTYQGSEAINGISSSVADEIIAGLPSQIAVQMLQASHATLDVCMEKLSGCFHASALQALCPSVSTSDAKLDIDDSPHLWLQRGTDGKHPVSSVHKKHPKLSRKVLTSLFDSVATLTSLSALRLSLTLDSDCTPVASEVARSFTYCLMQLTALTDLELRESFAAIASPAASAALPRLTCLQRLVVEEGQLSPQHMRALIKRLTCLPKLTNLSLSDNHLVVRTPKDATCLSAALTALKQMQRLKISGFSSLGKNKQHLSALSALTALTSLDVESIGITPATVPVFSEALQALPHLQHVAMSYNQLGKLHLKCAPQTNAVPPCLRPLCRALLSCQELRIVELRCTHLGYGGARFVVSELSPRKRKASKGRSLELLNLDGNMQSIEVYSEFYKTSSGGDPQPESVNKVFRHPWVQATPSNWM